MCVIYFIIFEEMTMKNMKKEFSLLLILNCFLSGLAFAQPVLLKTIPSASTNFVASEGRLFFTSGDSLWTSNGTPASTYFIKKTGEQFKKVTNLRLGTFIYFTTLQADGKTALWRTNGTGANTIKIAAYTKIIPLIVYNSNLYLGIDDGVHGYELWKINLSNSLSMVMDIVPGSGNGLDVQNDVVIFSDTLYFAALGGPGGFNIWKSNGTAVGTSLAIDLPFASHYLGLNLTVVDNTLYFVRNYSNGPFSSELSTELFKSNGTTAGTSVIYSHTDEEASFLITDLISLNNKLCFLHMERWGNPAVSLWTSDGTSAGTILIQYLFFDEANTPFYKVKNQLAITSINNNNFQAPIRKSDGTTKGTIDFHRFGSYFSKTEMVSTGSLLFFTDLISLPTKYLNDELSQSDLNSENTKSLRSIFGTSFEYSGNLTPTNENIYFTTNPYISFSPNVREMKLWLYDPNKPSGNSPYFTLVNASTDQDIQWLKEGDYIFKSVYPQINIRYNPVSTPGSVVFKLNGGVYRTENQAPYALAGDVSGDYNPWSVSPGNYELTATPYSGSNGSGTAGTPLTIHFSVADTSSNNIRAAVTTITNNISETRMDIYPNPSSENFTFSVFNKKSGIAKAEVYKMDGTFIGRIFEGNVTEGQSADFSWNGIGLQAGIYLVKYTCDNQQVTKKFVLTE